MKPQILEMKNAWRRALDALMALVLPCLMAYELIGQSTHEILGLCMAGLLVLHHAMNWKWHRALFRGKYTPYRIALTALDALMTATFLCQAGTGVLMARHVLTGLPRLGRPSSARELHLLGAYWGYVITCLHAGMHMTGVYRQWRQKTGAGKIAIAALSLCAFGYGVYAFLRRGFFQYMTLRQRFAFYNFGEPLVWFFLDYAAVFLALALAGCLLGCALQSFGQRRRNKN